MEHTKTYQEFKKNGNTKFVRYSEGAEMYHMSVSKFMQMAKDAKAIYKLGQLVLVNLKIFDEYIETLQINSSLQGWMARNTKPVPLAEKGWVITMKKISIILLSAVLVFSRKM